MLFTSIYIVRLPSKIQLDNYVKLNFNWCTEECTIMLSLLQVTMVIDCKLDGVYQTNMQASSSGLKELIRHKNLTSGWTIANAMNQLSQVRV